MSKINSDNDKELVHEVILLKFNESEILYFKNPGTWPVNNNIFAKNSTF